MKKSLFSRILVILIICCLTGCNVSEGASEIVFSSKQTEIATEKKKTSSATKVSSNTEETKVPEGSTAPVESSSQDSTETTIPDETSETSTEEKVERDLTAVHPVIRITSEQPIDSREEYVPCKITVEGTYDEFLLSDVSAQIRLRGNASLDLADGMPPYRIKFDEKANLLGLHDGKTFKSWVLLNQVAGVCADYLMYHLAQEIYGPDYYVPDTTPVKVYVNGELKGIYTACEQTQIKKNRINVLEAVTGEEEGDEIGYLFELDNYASGTDSMIFKLNTNGLVFKDFEGREETFNSAKIYTLKNDLLSEEQINFISQYMNNLMQLLYAATYEGIAYKFDRNYNLVKSSSMTPEEAIRKVIDVDSAVAIYLLNEISNNKDKGNGSFYCAIDFSKDAQYSKLTFTPPWDLGNGNYNRTEGFYAGVVNENPEGFEPDALWFIMLMYNDWFREEVANRLKELDESGEIDQIFSEVGPFLHTYDGEISDSVSRDIDRKIEFYQTRYQWLLSEFNQ